MGRKVIFLRQEVEAYLNRVIAQPGSKREPLGESAFWIACNAARPWRCPVFTTERTAAKRARPQSERTPFVTFRTTVLMRMACALALLGGHGASLPKAAPVGRELGIAFLQASALGMGGLAGETAGHTPLQITPVLLPGRGGQGDTALVQSNRAPQHGLPAGGKHGVPCLAGKLTSPHVMGQPDLPGRRGGWCGCAL